MKSLDDLRAEVDGHLCDLRLSPELGGLSDAVRYSLDGGGKRIRPVLCLAVGDAVGCPTRRLLDAAAAVELVHTFSLVHDDLPALDDDDVRRGRASTHAAFGEGIAVIAGDALLAEAFRLAASYAAPAVARTLADATLGMIAGQYLDLTGARDDELRLTRLKTGRLFEAAVEVALEVGAVPDDDRAPWRAYAAELGLTFQLVDDVLDGDGYAASHGVQAARELADTTASRALARLQQVDADTTVLAELVTAVAARTS